MVLLSLIRGLKTTFYLFLYLTMETGVDPDSIARKAIEKGIYTEDQIDEMEDEEIINIIFEPALNCI